MSPAIILLLLAAASFTLLVAVPALARRAAVYMVHDVRESVYAFGELVPGAATSVLYKDLLYMCAKALHTVRSGRVRDVLGLALMLTGAELKATAPGPGPQLEAAFQTEEARREILRLGRRMRRIIDAAWWATLWSSPFALLVVLPLFGVLWLAVRPRRRAIDSVIAQTEQQERKVIAQAENAASVLRERPGLAETIALTFRIFRLKPA